MAKIKCSKCSTVFEVSVSDPTVACPNCGTKYKNPAYKPETTQPVAAPAPAATTATTAPVAAPAVAPKATSTNNGESKFIGTVGSHFVLVLVNFLLELVTLTFATPWVVCRNYRWKIENQVIDGNDVTFTGKGGQLFGRYLLWVLLTIVTIGIYSFWIPVKIQQWLTENTHFENGIGVGESKFTGHVGEHLGISLLNGLLETITLGFGAAWGVCRKYRWQIDHKVVDGHRFRFDGKGGQLFGRWVGWTCLCIITIGIFGFWVPVKLQKWLTENTHIEA